MTDRQFEALIRKTADAQRKFMRLLEAAEEEYTRRYGCAPGDWDDDSWIDSLHGACGEAKEITIAEVEAGARMSGWSGSSAPLDANDEVSDSTPLSGAFDLKPLTKKP